LSLPTPPTPPAPPSPPTDSRLDEYLDGLLHGEELAQFERTIAADPALSAQVALQQRIDSSISAQFKYSANEANLTPPAPQPIPIARGGKRWILAALASISARQRAMLAVAAALLITCIYIYWPEEEVNFYPIDAVYANLDTSGWQPDFKCETDDQFAAKVNERFGSPVLIPMSTPGVTLVGWGYANDYEGSPMSKDAMYLLTTVEDRRVLVVMDNAECDRGLELTKGSKYHLFRKEIDGVVLYEMTPFKKPRVINAAVVRK